jgi:hypothetical protein
LEFLRIHKSIGQMLKLALWLVVLLGGTPVLNLLVGRPSNASGLMDMGIVY